MLSRARPMREAPRIKCMTTSLLHSPKKSFMNSTSLIRNPRAKGLAHTVAKITKVPFSSHLKIPSLPVTCRTHMS